MYINCMNPYRWRCCIDYVCMFLSLFLCSSHVCVSVCMMHGSGGRILIRPVPGNMLQRAYITGIKMLSVQPAPGLNMSSQSSISCSGWQMRSANQSPVLSTLTNQRTEYSMGVKPCHGLVTLTWRMATRDTCVTSRYKYVTRIMELSVSRPEWGEN